MSWKSSDSVSTPSYCDFEHSSCAVTRKKICVELRLSPGRRAMDFIPFNANIEWYAICIPPDVIKSSMRLEFENTSTAVGTHRIALSSNAFVTERKISFAIVMPTVEKCKYGGRFGWKYGTRINDNGTTVGEEKRKWHFQFLLLPLHSNSHESNLTLQKIKEWTAKKCEDGSQREGWSKKLSYFAKHLERILLNQVRVYS